MLLKLIKNKYYLYNNKKLDFKNVKKFAITFKIKYFLLIF